MEDQETVDNADQEQSTENENPASYIFDAGTLMKELAKKIAEIYGDDALRAGMAARVAFSVMGPTGIAFNAFVDVTLNDEPVDQAVLSQLAAAAVGSAVALR